MDKDLELTDLGDAKEETKGWSDTFPREESGLGPFKED
jgi:hypothetical protein